jgi:tripartite motif-containing protein 71
VVLGDGTIMVSEFGNNRVQQFDAYGRSLGVWGRVGRREGEVQYPWGVAGLENEIFVLDSGNNRVQVMREP